MMVIYVVVFVYAIVLMCLLKNIGKLHPIILLLGISIIIKTFSFILKFIYYQKYVENHYPTDGFKIASKILEYISDIFTILHLILLIKGWRIVRRKIGGVGRMKIAIYCCTYICIAIIGYLYYIIMQNKVEESVALYTHPSSIFYLVIRSLTLIWYIYSFYTTIKQFGSKRRFLLKMLIFGGIYIISPLIVYLIILAIDKWSRKFYEELIQSIFNVLCHILLLLMFTPGMIWSEKFPYFSTNMMSVDGKLIYENELKELLIETIRLRYEYNVRINLFKKELSDGMDLLSVIGKDLHLDLNLENESNNDGKVKYKRVNDNEFMSRSLTDKNKRNKRNDKKIK